MEKNGFFGQTIHQWLTPVTLAVGFSALPACVTTGMTGSQSIDDIGTITRTCHDNGVGIKRLEIFGLGGESSPSIPNYIRVEEDSVLTAVTVPGQAATEEYVSNGKTGISSIPLDLILRALSQKDDPNYSLAIRITHAVANVAGNCHPDQSGNTGFVGRILEAAQKAGIRPGHLTYSIPRGKGQPPLRVTVDLNGNSYLGASIPTPAVETKSATTPAVPATPPAIPATPPSSPSVDRKRATESTTTDKTTPAIPAAPPIIEEKPKATEKRTVVPDLSNHGAAPPGAGSTDSRPSTTGEVVAASPAANSSRDPTSSTTATESAVGQAVPKIEALNRDVFDNYFDSNNWLKDEFPAFHTMMKRLVDAGKIRSVGTFDGSKNSAAAAETAFRTINMCAQEIETTASTPGSVTRMGLRLDGTSYMPTHSRASYDLEQEVNAAIVWFIRTKGLPKHPNAYCAANPECRKGYEHTP